MPGAHLLIVDDEENLRSMLAAALRHHGFEVSSVADGRTALDAVGELSPDLVVLDVMLPDLDGFEVCRRLRADGNRTPVLFLTARDATEDKVRGLTLGGDDYLQKPFSLEELVARATAVLRRTGQTASERTVLTCGDLELDDDAHRVTKAGERGRRCRRRSTTCCATCSSTRAGCCRRRRSSTTSGSTTSAATAGWSRRTSATSAASSTPPTEADHTIRGVGYTIRARS